MKTTKIKAPAPSIETSVAFVRLSSARSVKEIEVELKGLTELEQLEALQQAIYRTEDDIELFLSCDMPALAASKTSLLTQLEDTKALIQRQYIRTQN